MNLPRHDVSASASGVVSIRAHASYRPDYSKLASGQVAVARQKLGMTYAEFADYLTDVLGWPVQESAVKRWEARKAPPGDVLLACAAMTQGAPAAAAPLLANVPPAFPPETLAGPWLTAYQFIHAGESRHHADIAHVEVSPDGRVRAVNHPPEPRSEGRARAFRNEIDAVLASRHLTGQWRNTSDLRYHGSLELAVLPGEVVMEGCYTGVASDIEVSVSAWKWVRLDPASVPVTGLSAVILREPAELYRLVMKHNQYGEPLALADVEGD